MSDETATPELEPANTPGQVANEAESTTAQAAEPSAPEKAAEPEARPEKKSGWEKRISKLTARNYELEQELAAARQAKEAAPQPQGAPNFDDFDTEPEYLAAVARYEAKQAVDAARTEEREAAAKAERQRAEVEQRTALQNTLSRGETKHADFEAVVMAEGLDLTATMLQVATQQEDGADVLYHLGKHPDEASRIAALPDYLQAVEIGRLSERLTITQRTSAPEPVKPVSDAAPVTYGIPDNLSAEEWVRRRRRQVYATR